MVPHLLQLDSPSLCRGHWPLQARPGYFWCATLIYPALVSARLPIDSAIICACDDTIEGTISLGLHITHFEVSI